MGEGVVGLIGEDVAVGQEEDAWAAGRFAGEIPSAVKEFPGDLEGDEGFSGSGGERQEDARFSGGDGLKHAIYSEILIIAALKETAFVFEGNGGEAVTPGVGFRERGGPEIIGRWVADHIAFPAVLHVDSVDALAVGGVGVADVHFEGVVLSLGEAFGQLLIPRLGFDDGEFVIAIDEDVIGGEGTGAAAEAFQVAECDVVFAENAAAFDDPPASFAEGGVDELGSGFGFVHELEGPGEGLVEEGFLEFVEGGEFALVDGFEALRFGAERVEPDNDLSLVGE